MYLAGFGVATSQDTEWDELMVHAGVKAYAVQPPCLFEYKVENLMWNL